MKKLFVIVLAAIGMVSCMNTDEVIEVNNGNAIAFADAFIENSVRAEINTGNLTTLNVWGWMQEDAVTATVFEGKEVTNTDGAGWTYSPAQYWVPGFTYNFQALSSNLAKADRKWTVTAADGKVSVVTFENVNGTEDLIYATAANVKAPELGTTAQPVSLVFNHQLAKVKFTFTYDAQLSKALGNGLSVKAENIKMVVPAEGKIDYSATIPTWELVGDETTELVFAAAGVEKLTIPAEDYTYAITFDVNLYQGDTKVKTLVTKTSSVVLDVVKGCAYNFAATLTPENLQMDSIDFTPEVNSWNPGGDAEFTTDTDTPTTAPVISNDEIWYTNGSTTEPTIPPYGTEIGVNIISNTYDMDKGYWVIKFDGDVTEIGTYAFQDCTSLTSITIPDSVTSIGNYAFRYCRSLTSITIPDSVTSIGRQAFYECTSLTSVHITDIAAWCKIIFNYAPLTYAYNLYLDGELVTDLVIPDSVTLIGYSEFSYCTSLTSVTIPDSVTSIGDYAFDGCTSLTSVTIPDSVILIGTYAFDGCTSLTSITIPDSVTSIGFAAFEDCTSLTSVTIGNGVTSIGKSAFYGCTSLTSVTIPDSVTSIGSDAFDRCTSLTSVTIGNGVTEIGGYAFDRCSSLTSITIPDSVTSIGDGAFAYCRSLTSITIPDCVTLIGEYAFAWCSSLTSVTIGNGVTSIGDYAFAYCTSLTSVYCKPTTPPTGDSYMFSSNASGRKIYVPAASVEAYKNAAGWSDYKSYIYGYDF